MIKNWPLKDLGLTHSIIDAYLNNEESIHDLYATPPTLEGIRQSISQKKTHVTREQRSTLVKVLHSQLDAIEDTDLHLDVSRNNINSLHNEQTFTITTGQQLHLFLGPGYFINKLFTCIKIAQHYNRSENEEKIVPLFWMASEDHDIAEIEGIELFGQNFKVELTDGVITGEQKTARILPLISALEERLGDEALNSDFFQICKKAYLNQPTLSKATAYIIYHLFAKFGIVVLDANNTELKKQVDFIFENEMTSQTTLGIQEEVKSHFDSRGFHYQVMPRGTNLFKIDSNNQRLIAKEETYDKNEIYSPNALLRPLYQEAILPNVAYIGGMAEVNYWLQLKPVFEYYSIPFPVVWLRDSIQISSTKKINQLLSQRQDITEIALFNEARFQSQFIENELPTELLVLLDKTNKIVQNISSDVRNQEWDSILKQHSNLSNEIKKHFRALKKDLLTGKNYQTAFQIIKKLNDLYFDKQKLQERTISCLSLELNYLQISVLEREYLGSSLHHGHYYLIGN